MVIVLSKREVQERKGGATIETADAIWMQSTHPRQVKHPSKAKKRWMLG